MWSNRLYNNKSSESVLAYMFTHLEAILLISPEAVTVLTPRVDPKDNPIHLTPYELWRMIQMLGGWKQGIPVPAFGSLGPTKSSFKKVYHLFDVTIGRETTARKIEDFLTDFVDSSPKIQVVTDAMIAEYAKRLLAFRSTKKLMQEKVLRDKRAYAARKRARAMIPGFTPQQAHLDPCGQDQSDSHWWGAQNHTEPDGG